MAKSNVWTTSLVLLEIVKKGCTTPGCVGRETTSCKSKFLSPCLLLIAGRGGRLQRPHAGARVLTLYKGVREVGQGCTLHSQDQA